MRGDYKMSAFVLNRNYELQLPNSYVDVDREEMEYIDGDGILVYQVLREFGELQ
jgi:hypothetical protein